MPGNSTDILKSLAACMHCAPRFAGTATEHRPNPIFQVSRTARLCVAGQAPGIRAHHAGLPFADPSGVRLRAWMGLEDAAFYDAARVAILPMAFCFPGYDDKGSDLPPPKDCARLWRNKLFSDLPRIEMILLVGKSAIAWHLPARKTCRLDEIVRDGPVRIAEDGPLLFPLPHPSWRNNAWLKKNTWFETDMLPRLRRDVARLVSP